MIYSAAKHNPELSLAWAREPEVGLPRPHVVVFLDLDPDEAEKRGGYGDEKYEKREMQERVRNGFHLLSSCGEEESEDMVTINAKGTEEEVGIQIIDLIKRRIFDPEGNAINLQHRKVGRWNTEHKE